MWSMWRSSIGGELGGSLKTWVRHMSRKRAENLRKINPKVPYPEATSIAQNLYNVVKERGPLTISSAWTNTQEAGVTGLNSKTHMKIMLKWMRGKKMLKQICQNVGSNKKFLLCTPDVAVAEQARLAQVRLQSEKPSRMGKKKKKKKAKRRTA